MTNFDETRLFDNNFYDKNDIHSILKNVVETIKKRGYDPINQLMGYIRILTILFYTGVINVR